MADEVEEEFVFKQRQEDREKEQLKIEKLEKQIGAADGSLKRLGENSHVNASCVSRLCICLGGRPFRQM